MTVSYSIVHSIIYILEGVNINNIFYADTDPPILHYFSSGGNNLIGIITYLIMKFFQKYFIGRDLS